MFSQEMESLIEATLQDGVLTDQEKAVLVKRAQKEGIDVDELDVYIQSLMQKRMQNQTVQKAKATIDHEKLRKGNICPHCAVPIPPLTKICPNCGRAINANETSGDKELFQLIDDISSATVKVKSANDKEEFKSAKAKCDALLKKAEIFYENDKKVQMLVFDLKAEIKAAESKLSAAERNSMIKNNFKWFVVLVEIIAWAIFISSLKVSGDKGPMLIIAIITVIITVVVCLKIGKK